MKLFINGPDLILLVLVRRVNVRQREVPLVEVVSHGAVGIHEGGRDASSPVDVLQVLFENLNCSFVKCIFGDMLR